MNYSPDDALQVQTLERLAQGQALQEQDRQVLLGLRARAEQYPAWAPPQRKLFLEEVEATVTPLWPASLRASPSPSGRWGESPWLALGTCAC